MVRINERNEKHECINPSSKVLALPLTVGLGHALKLVLLLDGVAAQRWTERAGWLDDKVDRVYESLVVQV